MNKTVKYAPIKRGIALKPLSRDHHHGLLLCWKIRTGLKKEIDTARIKKFTGWFFNNNLVNHFSDEEELIFPLLGSNHEYVRKAVAEHRRLKRLFEDTVDPRRSLSLIEEELERHIRFEERIMFPAIERVASEKELSLIMAIHTETTKVEDWGDPFWI
jgi:iron-sulfur cluster repair protein YtfE (RIC family)